MKFGLLFRPQDPPNAVNIGRRWQETLDAAQAAEEAGFDGVFVPEHHMMPDGYLPAPLVACGALAARTKRVDVGTTVFLLPYYNPVQVAEQSAMVDVISGGRMRLGCGLGALPEEFALYGIDSKTQISRFEEAIGLVREAWSGAELHHQGKHFTATGKISPVPQGAELWLGAMSDGGVRRAARFGAPWITDPLHNINVMSEWASLYRQAGAEYGTSATQQLVLLRDGWVADSLEEVERVWWPCIRAEHWFYFKQIPRWVADREPFLAGVREESDFGFDTHRIDRLVAGSPEDCIAAIQRFRDALGMDYLIMSFRMAAGPAHEEELACIRRFGRDVIPAFR
jgi:alkanesulfonate monooxygenase SsuD/methylene tetrahydromethanopterin reductase-like flavin-dependent oxidoreductase (luciferase family)